VVVEEAVGRVGDLAVDGSSVDTRRVYAALREFVATDLVALVDEDLVVDISGYDVEFGTGNVGRGEFGVLVGGVWVSRAPTMR
jgi:hypothetical protein